MKTFFDTAQILNRFKIANNFKSDSELADFLEINKSTLSNWYKRNSIDLELLFSKCEQISTDWLLTGEGTMLKKDTKGDVHFCDNTKMAPAKKLIPFYDDVSTIGGCNSISASMEGCMPTNEWIDAGDWFHEANAAIRHYGDSMTEYPSGCILALKKVEDMRLLLWGRNYCIETTEFRITKRLQSGEGNTIVAYSSNTDTYPDGRQIHEPKIIPMDTMAGAWVCGQRIQLRNRKDFRRKIGITGRNNPIL